MSGDAHRVAVIDVGTNSTRLLIAEVAEGRVREVERRSRVTRLGRGVDLSGQLSAEAIEAACEAIADYVAIYQEVGVDAVDAIATSAVRDASNGSAFVAELRERFALSARVLDGEEEARLTYLGATSEHPPPAPTVVIDIGGGSTELIVGRGPEISFHASLQAGVVRHTERHISSDPPTAAELESLAGDVRRSIEEATAGHPEARAEAGIGAAGRPHRDPRPAPRSRPDHRRRGRDPDRDDADVRARPSRGLRARHPLRGRDRCYSERRITTDGMRENPSGPAGQRLQKRHSRWVKAPSEPIKVGRLLLPTNL
jgi:hypothetical protein